MKVDELAKEIEEQQEFSNNFYLLKCSLAYEEVKKLEKKYKIKDKTVLHIAFQEIIKHELKQHEWKT